MKRILISVRGSYPSAHIFVCGITPGTIVAGNKQIKGHGGGHYLYEYIGPALPALAAPEYEERRGYDADIAWPGSGWIAVPKRAASGYEEDTSPHWRRLVEGDECPEYENGLAPLEWGDEVPLAQIKAAMEAEIEEKKSRYAGRVWRLKPQPNPWNFPHNCGLVDQDGKSWGYGAVFETGFEAVAAAAKNFLRLEVES